MSTLLSVWIFYLKPFLLCWIFTDDFRWISSWFMSPQWWNAPAWPSVWELVRLAGHILHMHFRGKYREVPCKGMHWPPKRHAACQLFAVISMFTSTVEHCIRSKCACSLKGPVLDEVVDWVDYSFAVVINSFYSVVKRAAERCDFAVCTRIHLSVTRISFSL